MLCSTADIYGPSEGKRSRYGCRRLVFLEAALRKLGHDDVSRVRHNTRATQMLELELTGLTLARPALNAYTYASKPMCPHFTEILGQFQAARRESGRPPVQVFTKSVCGFQ